MIEHSDEGFVGTMHMIDIGGEVVKVEIKKTEDGYIARPHQMNGVEFKGRTAEEAIKILIEIAKARLEDV